MNQGSLDTRMKRYEAVTDGILVNRMPVIIRLDGCHFHTFTKGLDKPFDDVLVKAMQLTTLDLCKNIQNCVFGYTQSDEITLVINTYQTLESSTWFDNRIQKICSVAASMCSRLFNENFRKLAMEVHTNAQISDEKYFTYAAKFNTADFDCRVFNIPREEAVNCVIWRQKDCEKNSVMSLAQTLYSQSELNGVKYKAAQNKMFTEKGVNWDELPTYLKRGTAIKKDTVYGWYIDYDMPILTKTREYLEDLV